MNEVILNGSMRVKNRSIVLNVYSVGMARFFIKNKIEKVEVEYKNNTITVKKGNSVKLQFERVKLEQQLTCIHITKQLPKEIAKKVFQTKGIPIKVLVKGFTTREEIDKFYNNKVFYSFENVDMSIPENKKVTVGCNISCFRNAINTYRLTIRNKIFDEIAAKKHKVVFCRDNNGNFIIRKRSDGMLFNYSNSKKATAYITLPKGFLTDKEIELFKQRRAISYKAIFSAEEFSVDISKYFSHSKERELAFQLIKQKVDIRIPKMRKREADIVLLKTGNQIEITTITPKKHVQKNNAHGEGIHINARICEGFLRVTKKIVNKYFLVLDERWFNFDWVKELIAQTSPNVICILTNFENNWSEKVAGKIKKEEEK